MACDTVNATAAFLSQQDNIQEFRLYDDGWGVPELREQGAGRAGLEAVLKGMMNARQCLSHPRVILPATLTPAQANRLTTTKS